MRTLLLVGLLVACMCTTASAALISYTNSTGGTVYQLNAPTSWAVTGGSAMTIVGGGPDGTDAYYRYGDDEDSTIAMWDFTGAALIPNVGQDLLSGQYAYQTYVSDYGALAHENDAVFGSANGPWGWHAMGQFSSWNGTPQSTPGWTTPGAWVGGYVWLSNNGWSNGIYTDMTVSAKWNPWSPYGGMAVSGVRISTDGNFAIPEPSSLFALLAGFPVLALLRRKR